jgi:ATP synthase protein I
MNDPDAKYPTSNDGRETADMAWRVVSYLSAGLLFYGGLGWLIGKYFGHQQLFIAAGLIIGIMLALYLTYARVTAIGRDATTSDLRNPPQ